MIAIRLSRTGTKKRPYYRLVVLDSTQARDSRFVEILGHYNPRAVPAVVTVDHERIAHWLKVGARPSDTVRTLLAGHVTNQPVAVASADAETAAPKGEASGQ